MTSRYLREMFQKDNKLRGNPDQVAQQQQKINLVSTHDSPRGYRYVNLFALRNVNSSGEVSSIF